MKSKREFANFFGLHDQGLRLELTKNSCREPILVRDTREVRRK